MKPIYSFFLLFSISVFSLASNANELKNHSSPYLALHGNDPVNWMEWSDKVIAKAKKENKLLFVSIGYFSCHWCHVMQRESYSDKGIAKQLNKNYISVKVDRELNPVLDKRLIEFVQVTTGSAGWPLNVFLTPDGYPLVGATYMPRKHFSSVLSQLDEKWLKEQKSLEKQAQEMSVTLNTLLQKQELQVANKTIDQLADQFVTTAMQYADTMQGGFGQQRKFPQIPQLLALLNLNKIKKNQEVDKFLQLTLEQMAQKGLHDEVAGGFYRYTTDPDWEIPHFEKMIYTNAMMPILYFDAAELYKNDADKNETYKNIALETIQYLKDEMLGSSNAYIASLSAVDNKDEEGGYYLWQQSELKKALNSTELKMANLYWNLNREDELPAGNLPRQELSIAELSLKLGKEVAEVTQAIAKLKNKLKLHRNKTRIIPKDTKLLAGMNGLVLSAFAKGLQYDSSLNTTGNKLSQFLLNLWDGKKLRRSAANAKPGTLYDYAAVSLGLTQWGISANNKKALLAGKAIATRAWETFYIDDSWVENPDSLLPEGIKLAHIADSSLISAEALLLRSSFLSDDEELIKKVKDSMKVITRSLETDIYGHGSLLLLSTQIKNPASK